MTASSATAPDWTVPAMGLIVLRVDETIEPEFRTLLPSHTGRLYVTRIQSGDDLTPECITAMEARLTEAAALLPSAADFAVVGYACTSASALLGTDKIARLISAGVSTRAVTDPLTAAVAQIRHLGLQRVGVISPYLPEIASGLCAAFHARGIPIAADLSLNESDEAKVVRLSTNTLWDAARRLTTQHRLDGLFLSCTNLRTAGVLSEMSTALQMPVMSSNQALAWHMARLGSPASGERGTPAQLGDMAGRSTRA